MHDAFVNVQSFVILNLLDDYNRERLGAEVDFWLPVVRITHALDQTIGLSGRLDRIRSDSNNEVCSAELIFWLQYTGFA